MYLLIVNILMIAVFAATPTFNNLPNSQISNYKGEISCNSEISTTIPQYKSYDDTKYKFDVWKLAIDDSVCINIWTNINKTITNNTNIVDLYDCNGILIGSSSNDYLASDKCKFAYFIQLKHLETLYEYKLKVFCSNTNDIQCDNTMRRLQSGENAQKLSLKFLYF